MEIKDQEIVLKRRISYFLTFLIALASPSILHSQALDQEGEDRFVRLMSAQSVRLLEYNGKPIRKAEGPARFLHNNTWLICDTALWDVNEQIIRALGHVSIEQENTELVSDSLVYRVDSNVAQFRGSLVQLRDKDNNTLRTRHLDYNTKDSVALFMHGGAMRDKDGQLIESTTGSYDSKKKTFTFDHKVNMFTDSIFIKTNRLIYESNLSLATYPNYVEAWKDDYMLAADSGWYNRKDELFFFCGHVHLMSEDREGWCDSLYFDRKHSNVSMLGNVQLTDSVRAVSSLAGRIDYVDSLSRVSLRIDPVVTMEIEVKGKNSVQRDTMYCRADTIDYWTVKFCDIDSTTVKEAKERVEQINVDAVANIRAKAAEAAAKAAAEAAENDPNRPPDLKKGTDRKAAAGAAPAEAPTGTEAGPPVKKAPGKAAAVAREQEEEEDEAADAADSTLQKPVLSHADSLAMIDSLSRVDSLARLDSIANLDTTKIGFVAAKGKVKVFRKSMQVSCDSLRYCDLDSLARLYINPVIWNEGGHQYNCDSLFALIEGGRMKKANLMSNAFVHVRADSTHFNQIRSTEMMANFDADNQLSRFDALGGATGLFFINEKERIATANKAESTILSADFVDGQARKVTYYESPKSNAFPVPQMRADELRLKGFCWDDKSRPKSPSDITSRRPRASQRSEYAAHSKAEFEQTEKYFKGYMAQVYRAIEISDSLRRASEARRQAEEARRQQIADSLAKVKPLTAADSLSINAKAISDSLHTGAIASLVVAAGLPKIADSGAGDSVATGDSTAVADSTMAAADSVKVLSAKDSLYAWIDTVNVALLTAEELAIYKKGVKDRQREARLEEQRKKEEAFEQKLAERRKKQEAKWEEKDRQDAIKQARKDGKKREKQVEKEYRRQARLMEQKAREDALLEAYKEKYLKKLTKQK